MPLSQLWQQLLRRRWCGGKERNSLFWDTGSAMFDRSSMSSHLGQCLVPQCSLQAEPILYRIGGSSTASAVSCLSSSSPSSSGLCLAMCTGGHAAGLRDGRRKFRRPGVVSCSIRSRREGGDAREDAEMKLSSDGDDAATSGEKTSWMVAALAAMLMVGAAAAGEPAMAFGWFGQPQVEKDPVEPFTLYGSILKKYLIEDVVENKVVGRKKGFTASACVNALDASKETPELQGVPAGLKVTIIGEPSCAKGQGQTREESCTAPCRKACQGAVTRYLTHVKEETGYVLDQADIQKVTETCSVQCFNEWCSNSNTGVIPLWRTFEDEYVPSQGKAFRSCFHSGPTDQVFENLMHPCVCRGHHNGQGPSSNFIYA